VTKSTDQRSTPKWWLIARHEFQVNIKKRSFLFGAFGVPLLLTVVLVIVFAIQIDAEENTERIGSVGYVDLAGVLSDGISVPENFQTYENEDTARAALEAGEIGAYFVVAVDYLETGNVAVTSRTAVPEALTDQFDEFLIANLGRDLEPEILGRLIDPIENTLYIVDSGRSIKEEGIIGLFIAPFIFIFVFLIGSQTTSGYLMSGVVEEKSNRIMEILVTTVTPFQLLFGKIVGLGALGLLQLVVWVGVAAVGLSLGQSIPFLSGVIIPLDFVIVGVIYFLLGYFLMASVMAGVGAVVGSEQESRQYAGIFSLLFSIPFFLIISFFTDPEGPVVTFLCLFPFTSPISVMLRMAFASMPLPLLLASIGILILTTLFVVWGSARIFRWALLMYGKRPSLREIIRSLRRGAPSMGTTAAHSDAMSSGAGR
jgi:ABC-2 type transport system permease protein